MGRTESLNLKNDYERACGWYGHFNKSEMALFSECTDRYAQKLLDTADIVREAIFRQIDHDSWLSPDTWSTACLAARTPSAGGGTGLSRFKHRTCASQCRCWGALIDA